MALSSGSFMSCIALVGLLGAAGTSFAGGECSKGTSRAAVVVAASEAGECATKVETVAVAAEGECSTKAETVAVAAKSECSTKAEVITVAAGGECAAHPATIAVAATGECSTKAETVAVAAKGECSTEAKVVAVAAGGECAAHPATVAVAAESECSIKAETVAVANEGECESCEAEVVAVGNSIECKACDAVEAAFAPINTECPGSGEAVTEGVTAQFADFTVGFCCENCQGKFESGSDEAKAKTVAGMVQVVNTECPGSGQAVDAEQVALYNGFAVGFCCGDCKAKFTAADDAKKATILAKFVEPVNAECPGSGQAISEATFAANDGVLVGFCCEDCQSKFMHAGAEKQHKITAKLVAASAGGCTDECKAAYEKAEAKS